MAIYSLRMTAVGKTTQKQPFTAAAHLKYITRKDAVTHVMSARMPGVRRRAIAWLKQEENDDRKNARLIDKLVLALPRELSSVHGHALVKAFAEHLTQGRASWFAAFHTKGKDANNPHCHLILRDRDFETGRRVMFLSAGKKEAAQRQHRGQSQPTTLVKVRLLWERFVNAALQVGGRTERVDHRTLKEQGIDREPQVHEGPNIRAMHKRGVRPRSRDRVVRNSPFRRGRQTGNRVVRYADIDRGVTRVEYNESLKATDRSTGDTERVVQRRKSAVVEPKPTIEMATTRTASKLWSAPTNHNNRSAKPSHAPVLSSASDAPVGNVAPPRAMTLTEMLALEHGTPAALPVANDERVHERGR